MNNKLIFNVISKVLNLPEGKISELDCNETLRSYSLNSINAMKLIVLLEDEFNIEVDDNDLTVESVETINKIIKLVEKYKVD